MIAVQVPQIRIQSQLAQIGMSQTFASLDIQQPQADVMIKQPSANMSLKAPSGELLIDQSQAWEEANLIATWRSIEKHASKGLQAAAEGTSRRANQGDQLMKIEHPSNPIIDQAQENGFSKQKSISLQYIPSPFAVKVDYIPANVQVDVHTEDPIIEATPRRPVVDFEPSVIDIYMKQNASLDIEFTNIYSTTV